MSVIDGGQLVLQEDAVDIVEVIKRNINSMSEKAETCKVELIYVELDERPVVIGDMIRISQIFSNLLSNSVKFTPENGRVSIGVKSISDDWVTIVVSDDGAGPWSRIWLLPTLASSSLKASLASAPTPS